jgi:hypothetical protein
VPGDKMHPPPKAPTTSSTPHASSCSCPFPPPRPQPNVEAASPSPYRRGTNSSQLGSSSSASTPLCYARFYLLPRLAHSASAASPTSLLRLPVSPRRISPEPTQAPSLLVHAAFLFSRARSSSLGNGAPRWLSCYNITAINQCHPEIAAIKSPMPKLVTSCKQFLKKTKTCV